MSVQPEPDVKDWTWVVEALCPECGLAAAEVPFADVAGRIRADVPVWTAVLAAPEATRRPRPAVWSPAEYGAHVRDVHRMFAGRLSLMLAEDEPTFDNWDQDATAASERYDRQDPAVVAAELGAAAESVAALYDTVRPEQLDRLGHRSNGSTFSVASIARYHLHDVVHHRWDVRHVGNAVTVAAYDADAASYRTSSASLTPQVRARLEDFRARLPPGARVLEIGSGGGRDAAVLEQLGLSVRRTDVAPGFVALLRGSGVDADLLDPLTDDLADRLPDGGPTGVPYDGVWANASLLHVARDDLVVVLRRLAQTTRPGAVLGLSLKEGDGEGWSTHGSVATPRLFVYWREAELRAVLEEAGWDVETCSGSPGRRGESWLVLSARRA